MNKHTRSWLRIAFFFALAAVFFHFQVGNEFDYKWVYPYLLLFTPFREATATAWETYGKINTKILRPSSPIPEILAEGHRTST